MHTLPQGGISDGRVGLKSHAMGIHIAHYLPPFGNVGIKYSPRQDVSLILSPGSVSENIIPRVIFCGMLPAGGLCILG